MGALQGHGKPSARKRLSIGGTEGTLRAKRGPSVNGWRRLGSVAVGRFVIVASLLVPAASALADRGDHPADPIQVALGPSRSSRPDAWIKLCGLSTGCTIHPPGVTRHWLGNGVYNTSGRRQRIAVDINEGEDARWWIMVENDGADSDVLVVDGSGCRGTNVFEVRRVLLGKQKRPNAGATDVTRMFKRGTLSFDLGPGERKPFTVLVVTHEVKGVTYECRITVHSQTDPTSVDTVVGEMTTY